MGFLLPIKTKKLKILINILVILLTANIGMLILVTSTNISTEVIDMFLKAQVDDIVLLINLGSDSSKIDPLIQMFETNAKFIRKRYNDVRAVEPEITIELGNEAKFEATGYSDEQTNLIVTTDSCAVGCVEATQKAYVDIDAIKDGWKKNEAKMILQIKSLSATKQVLESRIEELEAQLQTLESDD